MVNNSKAGSRSIVQCQSTFFTEHSDVEKNVIQAAGVAEIEKVVIW